MLEDLFVRLINFAGKLYKDTATPGGLLAVAIAHTLALVAAVAVASNASGGHVNPAVTFGLLVGRRISFGRAAVYWLAQMLGVVVASLLLTLVSGGTVIRLNFATCPCQILQYYFTFDYYK